MVAFLIPLAIAGGVALAGYLASRNNKKTPHRQLDTTRSDQEREQQQQLLNLYKAQAEGYGPSYADLEMRKGIEQARAGAASAGASYRGDQVGLAQRTIANQQAAATSAIAGKGALARADEVLAAKEGAATLATNIRSADLGQETTNLQSTMNYDATEAARKAANRQALVNAINTFGSAAGAYGMNAAGGGIGGGASSSGISAAATPSYTRAEPSSYENMDLQRRSPIGSSEGRYGYY